MKMSIETKIIIFAVCFVFFLILTLPLFNKPSSSLYEVKGMDAHAPQPLTLMTIREAQIYLKDLGYYDDDIDCIVGPNTIDAWERYSGNIDASGYINDKSVRAESKDIGEIK